MAALQIGDMVGHDYGEVPITVHGHVCGAHVANDEWVIITPDEDVYVEQCSPANPNLARFFYVGPMHQRPHGVLAGQ